MVNDKSLCIILTIYNFGNSPTTALDLLSDYLSDGFPNIFPYNFPPNFPPFITFSNIEAKSRVSLQKKRWKN